MKIKFRFWVLILAVLSIIGLLSFITILLSYTIRHPDRINVGIFCGVVFLLTLIILILREIRFKWNYVEVTNTGLNVRSFLGLGPIRQIPYREITGFKHSWEPSKISEGAVINIYENNKRIIEISDVSCKNFKEFTCQLKHKIKGLGYEELKYSKVLMNAFGIPIMLTQKL
ncbi:MAG: hypothetical protein ACK5DD_10160 [Cyclobacteriaceae bacterium]|jgi:hypothetical protein